MTLRIPWRPVAALGASTASVSPVLGVELIELVIIVLLSAAIFAALARLEFVRCEKKRLASELGGQNERLAELAAIVQSTDDAIMACTLDGRVTSWNRGAETLYGYTAEEMIGTPIQQLVPAERLAIVGETFSSLALGETVRTHDASGVRKDGSIVDVALTVSTIHNESGEIVGASTIARDISDRHAVEAEREALLAEFAAQNDRLRELDTLKDDFVASVSRELRTPLTSIRGYLELVRDDGSLDDEQERMLGIVDRNADRLLRLVSDLLFVAQVDAGRLSLQTAPVDLAELAQDAVEAARPRAEAGSVTLHLDASEAHLEGDRNRLAQVLDNLISNAIKFTPRGGSVDVRVGSDDEGRATLEVSDTGMGIPEAEQAGLFQRFFRSSGATCAAIQGTGLGLTIAKAIVESHGGKIGFTSVEGAGTTFAIELPAGVAAVAAA